MTVEEYFNRHLADVKRITCAAAWQFKIDPHDHTQDVILQILRNKDKFNEKDGKEGFQAWVSTIARNVAINKYRKERRKLMVDIDGVALFLGKEHNFNIDERATLSKLYRSLRARFPKHYALVMYMMGSGYKYQEIADHLDCPLNTVKMIVFKSRDFIQGQWSSIPPEPAIVGPDQIEEEPIEIPAPKPAPKKIVIEKWNDDILQQIDVHRCRYKKTEFPGVWKCEYCPSTVTSN